MFKMFAVRKRAILNACMRRANAPWRMYVRDARERTLITSQTSKFAIHVAEPPVTHIKLFQSEAANFINNRVWNDAQWERVH